MASRAAEGEQVRGARHAASGGNPWFQRLTQNLGWELFILACIVANAAILGIDAHLGQGNSYAAEIERWNAYFLYIFTAELALEFWAQGPRKYFRSGWNIFDMAVVGVSYIAVAPAISALRTLRVVRVFRLISAVPQMRRVVEALFGALPGILATFAVLAIVFYIGAVIGTTLFHEEIGFRNLGESALSLFALTQFDNWGETVMRLSVHHPFAWAFVLGFTIIAAFAVLNLFVGVIVEAVQQAPHDEIEPASMQRDILEEVRALRAEVAALRAAAPGAPP